MALLSCFSELLWSFNLVLISCEFAEKVTTAFEDIDDEINQLHWYLYPYEVRKFLPTIMITVQDTVNVECFGSIPCNRETFKNVSVDHNKKWL